MQRALRIAVVLVTLLGIPGLARADERPRWIVVTAPAFDDVIAPLAAHREAQGYAVVHVRMADVAPIASGDLDPAPSLRDALAHHGQAAPGRCSVLLVGTVAPGGDAGGASTVVPALAGAVGRMQGQPTDLGYGRLDDDDVPDMPVGRFPARTVAEARAMIAKSIAFEQQTGVLPWRDRITLLVGNPGGGSALEKRFASGLVNREITTAFQKVSPRWRTRAVLHLDVSPFTVPDDQLRATSLRYLQEGQLLSIYLGHSGAGGLASGWARFVTREDLGGTDFGPDAGILLTCGCWACHLDGPRGEGYGLAAIRNAGGAVAVVGAHGESYGALGKLAFEGLLPILAAEDPPARLGDWWLAIQGGLARGSISKFTFMLYDKADGSGGQVPLALQRKEHLEMWTLLGDPALRLPLETREWKDVAIEGEVAPGATLVVRGTLPDGFAPTATTVTVALERPFGALPPDLPALPKDPGPARDEAVMHRHAAMNDVVVDVREASLEAGRFTARLTLPAALPWKSVHVRIRATGGEGEAVTVRALPVTR